MDPQSQAFTPFSNNDSSWRLQTDVVRLGQVQAEHSERIRGLERRLDEDARVKSVWGNQSPFPSVLSGGPGGTPNQAPLNAPPSDQYRNFDDEANSLMNSLTNLDADDEPRRGNGATSRANSVRFDETANQNHFSHSSRPSVDYLSRSSSGGLGDLRMNERVPSHRSEGRASSAHSMRSAASGRASLNMDIGYGLADSRASPVEPPSIAPGMFLLGSVPAIIRCWMNNNFVHDTLLYAAVCTGSHKSWLDVRLIHKLHYQSLIQSTEDGGPRTITVPIFFPEAVPHPSAAKSWSPAPHLPNLKMEFQVVESSPSDDDSPIQIFLGSDVLRTHSADVLFSSNSLTLFDENRNKVSIPLVRPENEAAFRSLYIASGSFTAETTQKPTEAPKEVLPANGIAQGSSTASIASSTASPKPSIKYRPPGAVAGGSSSAESAKAGAGTNSDSDIRSTSRQSSSSRPSLNLSTARSELTDATTQASDAGTTSTPLRAGSSPAIWNNWRRDGGTSATPPSTALPAAANSSASSMDWASTSRGTRETPYQRRDTGMKVLKPKNTSRAFSAVGSATAVSAAGTSSPSESKSRFFDDGRRKSEVGRGDEGVGGSGTGKKEYEAPPTVDAAEPKAKTKANPVGGASAFRWLNTGR